MASGGSGSPARSSVRLTSERKVGRCSKAVGFWGRYAIRPGLRSIFPDIGDRAPAMSRSKVVLPPPFGPERATTSPWWPNASIESSTTRPPKPALTPASDQARGPVRDLVVMAALRLGVTGHAALVGP